MKAHQIAVPTPAVSGQLDNASGRLLWWAFRETTGAAPCTFRLWDGSNNAGRLMVPFSLSANGSTRDYPGMHSLPYVTGLYLEVLTGTFEGTVYVLSGKHDEPYGIPVIIIGDVSIDIGQVT